MKDDRRTQEDSVPAELVIDPALPKKTRKLLQEWHEQPGRYLGSFSSPIWAAAPVIGRGGGGVAVAALAWWYTGTIENHDPADGVATSGDFISDAVQELADTFHLFLTPWPVAAGLVILVAGFRVLDAIGHNKHLSELDRARKGCVQPKDLTPEARTLLARAQRAKKVILTSTVHRQDLIDRQRNELSLPIQEWEIADALREYSRLVRNEPAKPKSEKVVELLDTRRRALDLSREGIERRVSALEAYAVQVAEADRQYVELQQIRQLTAGSDDVLDLLARTARDDLAVAEVEGMTHEAAVVAATFTTALETARQAAVIALPTARDSA